MGGAVGIDGKVLLDYLGLMIKSPKKRLKVFDQVILISNGALLSMSDKKAKKKREAGQ